MRHTKFWLIAALLTLSACGSSSHRPTYSGHEENTEGVPGFVNGYKVSPNVKLGQSYTVDGETYVPHYDHDYVEEGLASWYGPGFHGGKTANGEQFDKNELTAAHRTLPLPSIVRVTLLSTGKSAYVRVNDRGPFAKSRIIDLSYGAANAIGLIGKGVDRVRVEYMPEESQRFVDLLAQGRDPHDINIASEVIGQHSSTYAQNAVAPSPSPLNHLNPVSEAQAGVPHTEVTQETFGAYPQEAIQSRDLTPSASVATVPVHEALPPAALPAAAKVAAAPIKTATLAPLPTPTGTLPAASAAAAPAEVAGGQYLQLGAFLQESNAQRVKEKVASIGPAFVSPVTNDSGATLYRVRMGPYANVDESSRVLDQLNVLGLTPKLVTK